MVRDGKGKGPLLGGRKGQILRFSGRFLAAFVVLTAVLVTPVVAFAGDGMPAAGNNGLFEAGGVYLAASMPSDEPVLASPATASYEMPPVAVAAPQQVKLKQSVISWLEQRSSGAGTMGRLLLSRTGSGFKLDVGTEHLALDWQVRF